MTEATGRPRHESRASHRLVDRPAPDVPTVPQPTVPQPAVPRSGPRGAEAAQQPRPQRPELAFHARVPPEILPRPRVVDLARRAWVLAALAGVAAAVLVMLDGERLADMVRSVAQQEFPDDPATRRDAAAWLTVGVLAGGSALLGLLAGAAGAFLSWMRGSARYLIVVLVPGYAVELLFASGLVNLPVILALSAGAAASAVATVAMFVPAATRWFDRRC